MAVSEQHQNRETVVHLTSCQKIADTFGVSRKKVVAWFKDGAPIYRLGERYQANYNELWTWIQRGREINFFNDNHSRMC